nr:hypothetical protein Iba_chr07aCG8520 [Ipomoea batatas]
MQKKAQAGDPTSPGEASLNPKTPAPFTVDDRCKRWRKRARRAHHGQTNGAYLNDRVPEIGPNHARAQGEGLERETTEAIEESNSTKPTKASFIPMRNIALPNAHVLRIPCRHH